MKTRTELINFIIQKKDYKSYLEIGVQTVEQNHNHIKVGRKVGVDPNVNAPHVVKKTSNQFFKDNTEKFDIIFIDGLHTSEQSLRDYNNAVEALNEDGIIVMHDVLPKNQEYAGPNWCGDVYKTALVVASVNNVLTLDEDHGVLVVKNPKPYTLPFLESDYRTLDYLKDKLNAVKDTAIIEDYISDKRKKHAEELIKDSEDLGLYDFSIENATDQELEDMYIEKFGKKPHHRKLRETIIKELND